MDIDSIRLWATVSAITDRKLLLWHRITLAPGGLRGDGKFRRIPYRPPVLAASSSQNAISSPFMSLIYARG